MKKFCVNCEKKQGFLSLNYKLKDGVICDGCLEPFNLATTQLKGLDGASAIGEFAKRSAEEVKKAIKGENDLFTEIRAAIYSDLPAGVLFKFDGGLGSTARHSLCMRIK